MQREIHFTLNGESHTLKISANRLLVDVLREDLHKRGTKMSCGQGECGSCTVLLDGEPVNSCLILGIQIDGCNVETVEGLAKAGELSTLQNAFIEHGAVQCGYCTSGMLMSAEGLLREKPDPSFEEINATISGNLCRCTGYVKIKDAISSCAKSRER